MKKIQPRELLAKISKKINLKELLTLKTDLQALPAEKMSLQDLQELLTKIAQNKNKLTLVIIVISIILCLDFSLVLRFQMRALGTIKPKIIELRRSLKNLNSDLIMMQRHQKGLGIGTAKKTVPSGQIPSVIEEISRLANQHEVKISKIKPLRWSSTEKAQAPDKSSRIEGLSLIFLDLEVSAGYHQLGSFLADLENHTIFLAIEELEMKQSPKDPFEHKIKLQLKTYASD